MNSVKNTYEKFIAAILCVVSIIGLALGINRLSKEESVSVIGGADGPTAIYFKSETSTLQGVIRFVSSAALLTASVGTLLLTGLKMLYRKEAE